MYAVGAIPFTDEETVRDLIIKASALGADFVELRLDYWQKEEPPPLEGLVKLARTYGLGVIVTVRRPEEGGLWDPPWRDEAYRKADELGLVCDTEVKFSNELPCEKTILSVHFFNTPPEEGEIKRLSEKAMGLGAWAFKVAIKTGNYIDDVSYFARVRESVHPRTAFMPMGERAERLRLASVALGSFLNYGSVLEPTAPGQVRLSKIVKVLRSVSNS